MLIVSDLARIPYKIEQIYFRMTQITRKYQRSNYGNSQSFI